MYTKYTEYVSFIGFQQNNLRMTATAEKVDIFC